MVNKSQIKIRLLRVFIITGLMSTGIFPGSTRALAQDFSTGANTVISGRAAGGVLRRERNAGQLAPLA
ncbi:MAG: hypothetical protein L0287_10910, partial [Anaerolineae bacterium]|nr:hypothetical protein [Anaerolineae bacterium]